MGTRPPDISIHALREEGDSLQIWENKLSSNFYPRPPRGGRPPAFCGLGSADVFLSTPSARRATRNVLQFCRGHKISIHALREEGDSHADNRRLVDAISIHALREEGDPASVGFAVAVSLFLSTPSARRATARQLALRRQLQNFYPRPPRGGRPVLGSAFGFSFNFYPRPPRGGRRGQRQAQGVTTVFLSTPSARRATAKTETKSLFSNKLYNILHEFRRALIYNGSKSYPNHAK